MDKTYVFEGFLNNGDGNLTPLLYWKEEIGYISSDRHMLYFVDDCNIVMDEHEDIKGIHRLYVSTDKPLRFALRCLRDALCMRGYDFYINPSYKCRVVKSNGVLKTSTRFFRDPLALPQ